MFNYGFELEGFIRNKEGNITLPPKDFPVDGFPGLVEIRTTGGNDLEKAYADTLKGLLNLTGRLSDKTLDITTSEHKFSGGEISLLRKDRVFAKEPLNVQNLYGKEPRNLSGRTLASFQINVSYTRSHEYTTESVVEGKIKKFTKPVEYGQLDVGGIVRRLDKTFSEEIKLSKRQPGMYAIKDGFRLEYRSLPNSVFATSLIEASVLLKKIKEAVETN